MRSEVSVTPAILGQSPSGHADGVPYSPVYDDVYHAVAGAWAQARHVFLAGNGLPGRWQGRRRFVILETGFGLGNNFLATWSAWRRDPERCGHLVFVSIEKHPLRQDDLAAVHGLASESDKDDVGERRDLAQRLVQAWPPLTPGLHSLRFDEPGLGADAHAKGSFAVTLILGLGDIAELLPKLVLQADAFYLDGFAPAKNPQMWDEALLSRLNRLAADGSTAATWSAARSVRDALARAGFEVERAPGFAGKRDMIRARYAPRHMAALPAGGLRPEPALARDRHAIVVGAGLAGCAAALALCREGWRVSLIDACAGPAGQASGNAGGLYHSVLHGEDGVHARAHRAAALASWRQARQWLTEGRFAGSFDGLLRLDARADASSAQALLARCALPPEYVQWLDAHGARRIAGVDVPSGGWLFHHAGWLHPAGFARAMLDEAQRVRSANGAQLDCLWHRRAARIHKQDGRWQVLDGEGSVMAAAATLILCNGVGAKDLLGTLEAADAAAPLPISAVRGQITEIPADAVTRHAVRRPKIPVAGGGYALALRAENPAGLDEGFGRERDGCLGENRDGSILCGATAQHDDTDPAVRGQDHRHNLLQAAKLGLMRQEDALNLVDHVRGRTQWRAVTPDRLPLIGAVPWSIERLEGAAGLHRLDQVRMIPRLRDERGGLFVLAGLGSRGITWSCLAGQLLAHWVAGTPCPVEADLRDALDPARFVARQWCRQTTDAR